MPADLPRPRTRPRARPISPGARSSSPYVRRGYSIRHAAHAQALAEAVVGTWDLVETTTFGLPEVDDRYHVWRVPIMHSDSRVGELVVSAKNGVVDVARSSKLSSVQARIQAPESDDALTRLGSANRRRRRIVSPTLRNTILSGPSEQTLSQLPAESAQLMFTSPPYFNARPDYADYRVYSDYLSSVQSVIREVHRVLEEGRFAVVNCAPVLVRRARRSESSKRLAVPFDLHQVMTAEGFDFIDDIIWQKPEGAGWATGRGRRFSADRNPLQYKAVPVTEYVLVYRKRSPRLIDWHIRNHPDKAAVRKSRIADGYEVTNIWKISPAHSKHHPAIFPQELAEKIIRYYSFVGDVVLDPYAGIGTVGAAATKLERRFVLGEINSEYVDRIRKNAVRWLGRRAADVLCVDCTPLDLSGVLL